MLKKNYYSEKLKKNNSTQKTWNIIKEVIGKKNLDRNALPTNLKINNNLIVNKSLVAETLNNFFVNVGSNLASKIGPSQTIFRSYLTPNKSVMSNHELTEDELLNSVSLLKPNKSSGADDVSSIVIIKPISFIKIPLFNLSLKHGVFPENLKCAKVTPIYKTGDPSDVSNYRPISILTCFSKILERVMYNRLFSFLTNNKILYDKQFGFKSGHSTDRAIIHLVHEIFKAFDENKFTLGVFIDLTKSWLIDPSEIQISFDVVALYPSIPIDRAIPVIIDILNNDIDNLKKRTKLTLSDIHEMIELCLKQCYFLYKNEIRSIPNSGSIGLSLMVVVAEAFLQHLETKALIIAEIGHFSQKTYRRYVDDSHARFDSIQNHDKFLKLLNEQDPAIKYTSEKENNKKELNFLDITVTNTNNSYYNFKIHRKSAITNIQIKPTSNVNPKIVMGVFKGFVSRAVKICSKKYLNNEIQFLVNMFAENGHDRLKLETTAKNYIQKRINLSK
ncbi:uncharacterized protein LOC136088011 [Hydra vulgaris]|uniref:Uncharacterized protein LOC136088011 n=1 Tax=Hydra vulgaris TaxID=6087 RepID=A0ABM4D0F5_HYDVU